MADPVMKEAGKRFIYAMNCDSQENFQEAYKHYLYTTTFISSEICMFIFDFQYHYLLFEL